MTETGRPFGGTNQRPDDETQPGERPVKGEVTADDSQSPRAAQGGMPDDVTHVPDGGPETGPDAKKPGVADATGPQG